MLFTILIITLIIYVYKKGNVMKDDSLQADGYYGEDEVDNQELDLSFLDDDEEKK